MKSFFYCDNGAYLKCNGNFLGEIDCNLKFCDVPQNSLLEILPKSKNHLPVYLNSNDYFGEFTANFNTYYVFKINLYKRRNLPFKLLLQKSFYEAGNNYTVTVVSDGVLKFYLDGSVYALDELPLNPTSIDLKISNGYLFLSFYSSKVALFVYDVNTCNLVFKDLVDHFELTSSLITTSYKTCGIKLTVKENWDINSGFLKREKSVQKTSLFYNVNKNLLPVVFLNLLKEDGDVLDFLHPTLKDRVLDLKNFFSNFETACLNPFNFNEVLVFYKEKLSRFCFEFSEDKIINVIENN